MPSSASPLLAVTTLNNGPRPPAPGVGGVVETVTAHLGDPIAAHAASAISYNGGVAWADGTTNPVGDVETQLDKILSDLATGDGAGKIRYNGGVAWADGTTNPVATVGAQLDKIIADLVATTDPAGAKKIGARAISHGTVAISAGTVDSQLFDLSHANNIANNSSAIWADTTTVPSSDVQDTIDEIVTRLASTTGPDGGTRKVGGEAIVNTSATITAGTLLSQLTLLSRAANLQYNAGPAWLGGRTNTATTVQLQIDKIINDLGASGSGDDGAERIGAAAAGDLTAGSVRSQLNQLDVDWGKTQRANTWTNTQTVEGLAGDQNAIFLTDTLPFARKLLWQVKNRTVFADIYKRVYNDKDLVGLLITDNARWNGTNWAADDTTVPATMWRFEDNGSLVIALKSSTGSVWATNGWDSTGTYTSGSIDLGGTTVGGPATVVCNITAENGRLTFANSNDAGVSDTNPPATQGHINVLKAKNIVKLWANITTSFDTVQDGFNIASVVSSGNVCTVNIQSDMAADSFACVAMCMTDSQLVVYSSARTTGSVDLKAYNASTNVQVNLETTPIVISVILIGKQDS